MRRGTLRLQKPIQISSNTNEANKARKHKIKRLLQTLLLTVSLSVLAEFAVFLYYWIVLNLTDTYLNALFAVVQGLSILIPISLYVTLISMLLGGISGLVGAIGKKSWAVFTSAIFFLEIFLGQLEFGLIGSIMSSSERIDEAVAIHQGLNVASFVEAYNETDVPENMLWVSMQIKFQCCGMNDMTDWRQTNPYFIRSLKEDTQMYPLACCKDMFEAADMSDDQLESFLDEYDAKLKARATSKGSKTRSRRRRRNQGSGTSTTGIVFSQYSTTDHTFNFTLGSFFSTSSDQQTEYSSVEPGYDSTYASRDTSSDSPCLTKYPKDQIEEHFFTRGCEQPFLDWYAEEMQWVFTMFFAIGCFPQS